VEKKQSKLSNWYGITGASLRAGNDSGKIMEKKTPHKGFWVTGFFDRELCYTEGKWTFREADMA